MSNSLQPGLLILHGNRLELLCDAVFAWQRRAPLQPLEEEIFLVQSNGVAEWLKMTLAAQTGICAATRVELPGRFLWRTYRQVLGRDAVPAQSPLDKLPLTWRLMALLPQLIDRPGFEPLAGFLRPAARDGADPVDVRAADFERRLQLAERLADLCDQYQVYRSDWLADWAAGRDRLARLDGMAHAGDLDLPPDQGWQAKLWRELLAPLSDTERAASRPQLQRRFLAALGEVGATQRLAGLVPRRVVLFGMTHVPMQTLQALAALAAHTQVVLAIPNPCRFHWAETIDGRELLRLQRRRHPHRADRDLAAVPLQAMHAHAHPLLAAWGRQGRDFVRQLDAFDEHEQARERFAMPRIDLFDAQDGGTLLQQVQQRIRDLVPLKEHVALAAAQPVAADDRSIVFHVAHSAQREVEVLHDQLLALLARRGDGDASPLAPRDIVVMVPDIDAFAPAIHSVFGQHPRGDARFIPHDITDLQQRGHNPLLVALEWLLSLPTQRARLSEVRDLLDVPALAKRFGLVADDLPLLTRWLAGAGIRWGLDGAQRATLGLASCGEQNTWLFGLHRMLLGYAVGAVDAASDATCADAIPPWPALDAIAPYSEVGGLDAALAGSLADLVQALLVWQRLVADPASREATPAQWAARARDLLAAFFDASDERERLALAALDDALLAWMSACDTAGFDSAVPLAVLREAWLAGLDEPGLSKRFRAGGVTFCTLLPMRAIPFEVVCLLGMNDGDYPRSTRRSDFDLMGLPGLTRPGDRSRREDDRQLMLEALLSARRVLYLSWTGRSVRDHSEIPPSVLVSQLRDYLDAGWPGQVVAARTTEHPLQPFSRRYFEAAVEGNGQAAEPALFTHAREWRAAHAQLSEASASAAWPAALPPHQPGGPLTLAALTRFLKNPVNDFFRQRLDVRFDELDADGEDDESFGLDGLQSYTLVRDLLGAVQRAQPVDAAAAPGTAGADAQALGARIAREVDRVQRAGALPMAAVGERTARQLINELGPMLAQWQQTLDDHPKAAEKQPLRRSHGELKIADWLDDLWTAGPDTRPIWVDLQPRRLLQKSPKDSANPSKLVDAWVRTLVASACGLAVDGVVIGTDATLRVHALAPEAAQQALGDLLDAWHHGMAAPLPVALRTGIAIAADRGQPHVIYDGSSRGPGEGAEPCLARAYPDFEALDADARLEPLARQLYGPLVAWVTKQVQVTRHPDVPEGSDDDDADDGGDE